MKLSKVEAEVAYSMIDAASKFRDGSHTMERFSLYWMAFNNIYVTLADQDGRRPNLRRNKDGTPKTRSVGNVEIPEVDVVRERDQLKIAFGKFTNELRKHLVEHECTKFFVYRTPKWKGQPIEKDSKGQILNGVLKSAPPVTRTIRFGHRLIFSCLRPTHNQRESLIKSK